MGIQTAQAGGVNREFQYLPQRRTRIPRTGDQQHTKNTAKPHPSQKRPPSKFHTIFPLSLNLFLYESKRGTSRENTTIRAGSISACWESNPRCRRGTPLCRTRTRCIYRHPPGTQTRDLPYRFDEWRLPGRQPHRCRSPGIFRRRHTLHRRPPDPPAR